MNKKRGVKLVHPDHRAKRAWCCCWSVFCRAVFNAVAELEYICLVSPNIGALGENHFRFTEFTN